MRRIFTCFLLLIGIGLSAQDYPQFSQHVNLQGIINPAYNGSRESYSAVMVTRNQWGGALKTHAINAHAPLPIDGLGAGLVVIQDNLGEFSNLRATAAVSYHVQLSNEIILAAGLQGGLLREQVSTPSFDEPNDPLAGEFGITTNRPSAGLGFYIYSSTFFGGLSLPEVLPDGLDADETLYNDIPLLLYGGMLLDVTKELKLKPTAFIEATYASPMMMEFGVSAFYKEFGSVGISTRTYPFSALVFALEIQVVDNFFIAYSYDLALGGASGAMKKGTHEISLRFDITSRNLLTKPGGSMRYF
ncbi:MAG: PorP/SprF family type IX secretion system membrane protein [Bacteroidales bacterium]|jgi:type IX secretion system PorP/SprF family membrane protein|nr:PorP/SprF family type IX secretion system membrane protein [Bacteroidales bacterium]